MLSGIALDAVNARGRGGGGSNFDGFLCLCWYPGEFAGDWDWQGSAGWEGVGGSVFVWGSCYGWDGGDPGSGALEAVDEDGHGK